jgi:alpha-tubulin suppressor-like RCC1 family protein
LEGDSLESEVLAQGNEWLHAEPSDESPIAPALVPGPVLKAVSAGNSHSLALRTDGSVWAWGLNSDGQLGNGTQTNSNMPLRVAGLPVIQAIAAGRNHSLALGQDGTVWVWGQNSFGQLGDGTTTRRLVPVAIAIPGGAVAIAGGLNHSLAVAANGSVYAWGSNSYGQLGDETTTTRLTPVRINLPINIRAVSAGWYHSMALGTNGHVWTWGRNLNGQIGSGSASSSNQLTPYRVNLALGATAIATGANHSLALLSNQSVVAWGQNSNGQIGNGTTATAQSVPVSVGLVGAVAVISAGSNFSLAIDSTGTAWSWGQNNSGQLGDGTTVQRTSPVSVQGLNDAVAVSGGLFHALALRPGCPFWAWGLNTSGQLGDGTLLNRLTLTQTQLLNIYFYDLEGDGYGAELLPPEEACQAPGAEYVENGLDCDDFDPFIHPGASEFCDGLDNDCDTVADENLGSLYHRDADQDGYGNPVDSVEACTQPPGRVLDATDCNDARADVRPGAPEVCDGVDNNCNMSIDEGVGSSTWYRDADGDGRGNPSVSTQACSAPAGYVANGNDCNDADASLPRYFNPDQDGDGYGATFVAGPLPYGCTPPAGYVASSGDCNDTRADVRPGAPEVCDGVDNNCNASTDEGVGSTWYRDADGDGRGNPSVSTQACSAPAGYVANGNDCNDADASLPRYFNPDQDGDGYGATFVAGPLPYGCTPPAGYVASSGDCNDTRADVRPGAPEVCDGVDNNCNASIDEGFTSSTWYRDADGDGRGNPSVSTQACSAPAGYVANGNDCNDADASLPRYFNPDQDRDGYGATFVAGPLPYGCTPPAGYVAGSGDCNDTRADVRPGAPEVCDGVDNNCNMSTDEGCAGMSDPRPQTSVPASFPEP